MTFRGATMEFHGGCGGVAMSPLAACHGTPRGVPLIVLPRNGISWGCTTMTMPRKIQIVLKPWHDERRHVRAVCRRSEGPVTIESVPPERLSQTYRTRCSTFVVFSAHTLETPQSLYCVPGCCCSVCYLGSTPVSACCWKYTCYGGP